MAWYKNVRTGVIMEITNPIGLDVAEGDTDMQEIARPDFKSAGEDSSAPEPEKAPEEPKEEQEEDILDSMGKPELKEMAKDMKISGFSKMTVEELRQAIREA